MARTRGLGELERQVMNFLWEHGEATGEAVRLAVGKQKPLSDSTIRTVLRRLEEKKFVRRKSGGRQYVYYSVRAPRKVAADTVRSVLQKFCRGSLEELLAGLVDHRVVDKAELRRAIEKIEAHEGHEDRKGRGA